MLIYAFFLSNYLSILVSRDLKGSWGNWAETALISSWKLSLSPLKMLVNRFPIVSTTCRKEDGMLFDQRPSLNSLNTLLKRFAHWWWPVWSKVLWASDDLQKGAVRSKLWGTGLLPPNTEVTYHSFFINPFHERSLQTLPHHLNLGPKIN